MYPIAIIIVMIFDKSFNIPGSMENTYKLGFEVNTSRHGLAMLPLVNYLKSP